MIEEAAIGLAFAVLVRHAIEAHSWTKERAALLAAAREERRDLENRIMARSYSDFVYTQTQATVETPQMTTDEAEAAWHEQNKATNPDLYPDEVEA